MLHELSWESLARRREIAVYGGPTPCRHTPSVVWPTLHKLVSSQLLNLSQCSFSSPNTELALDVTFWIWLFYFRTEVMVSLRYFVVSVIQSNWPWSIYMGGYIFYLLLWRPTLIAKDLPTLNSIHQVSSHLAILSRSIWSRLMSFLSATCLYKIQSFCEQANCTVGDAIR